jgi:hypothetical protein
MLTIAKRLVCSLLGHGKIEKTATFLGLKSTCLRCGKSREEYYAIFGG